MKCNGCTDPEGELQRFKLDGKLYCESCVTEMSDEQMSLWIDDNFTSQTVEEAKR